MSHSHSDKPFVRLLAGDIVASNIPVWLDEVELGLGDPLLSRISEAIEKSAFLCACISPSSLKSRWVKKELEMAMTREIYSGKVTVLPILLAGVRDEDLPLYLRPKFRADFRSPDNYDAAFHLLVRAIVPKQRIIEDDLLIPQGDVATARMNSSRSEHLTTIARANPQMRDWVERYLIAVIGNREDPTERYWAYVTLGRTGGNCARNVLKQGLQQTCEWDRQGASDGLELLG